MHCNRIPHHAFEMLLFTRIHWEGSILEQKLLDSSRTRTAKFQQFRCEQIAGASSTSEMPMVGSGRHPVLDIVAPRPHGQMRLRGIKLYGRPRL
jgi:hypothetical protein